MGERNGPYPAGTPCWVDLTTTDPEAARAFYSKVFGWRYEVGGEDMGHYAVAHLGEQAVSGLNGMAPAEGVPPVWVTYLATDDIAATAARATAAGGTVFVGPMEVPATGHMALVADPVGAVVGLWQATEFIGCELVNVPGALVWNELVTIDLEASSAFYAAVAGFEYQDVEIPLGTYRMLVLGGRFVGGMMAKPPGMPEGVPPHWMTYFAVADTDASCAAIEAAGGSVVMPPSDAPHGRWAVVTDPQGATFTVLAPSMADD